MGVTPVELVPISHDSAELMVELVRRNQNDPRIVRDFSEMLEIYGSLEDAQERIKLLYDSEKPTRYGYIATAGARKEPIGVGYLGLGRQSVTYFNGLEEGFDGINLSYWVNAYNRRRGVARQVSERLLADIPTLRESRPDWQDAKLWTGIRAENLASHELASSLGLLAVGRRTADSEYLIYI